MTPVDLNEVVDVPSQGSGDLTVRECSAMRLLADDGWSIGELAMCFQLDKNNAIRHVRGQCSHETIIKPVVNYHRSGKKGYFYVPKRDRVLHYHRGCPQLRRGENIQFEEHPSSDRMCDYCCG